MTNKLYWILLVLEDGYWAMHFGDYSRRVVLEEARDLDPRVTKVFNVGETQADIDAAVAKMNAK
jgi:hypothetical protein